MSGGTRPPGARSQSVQDLVDGLASSGWGPLAGPKWRATRQLLQTLAKLARSQHTDRRGVLTMSASQIIEQAGYGETWGRKNLHVLEDLGVIRWERGGIVNARPQPSRIRIVKTALREIRSAAKPSHDDAERRRREAFARRLLTIRNARLVSRRCTSVHVSVSDSPTYSVGRWGRPTPAPTPSRGHQITPEKETNDMYGLRGPTTKVPTSVYLTRKRDAYLARMGIVTPEDLAYAHRNMRAVMDMDAQIATARKAERRQPEEVTTGELF